MFKIEMHEASDEFADCLNAAAQHLEASAGEATLSWLKADLAPPFLEHLSFRLGNQLFFIRLQDVDHRLDIPANTGGLITIAEGCKGHACLMPMQQRGSQWIPVEAGWGMIDARSGKPIDPLLFVSDEKIEMTDWELHSFAVQVVCEHLSRQRGCEVISSQGNPGIAPSIWFVGDHGHEWVLVSAVRYPVSEAFLPPNISEIAQTCGPTGDVGHFASVSIASADDAFDPENTAPTPLWRGHGMYVSFKGLVPAVGH